MPHQHSGPRSVALIGPYGSGKSTLFDALLAAAGGPPRRGAAPRGGTRIGHCDYLGESWALLDCPGSVEFAQEAEAALSVADIAVLVVDPDPERAIMAAPLLRAIEARHLPAIVFVNRIDTLAGRVRDTLEALQALTPRRLLLRAVPLREGEAVVGYVDVASEQAYRYQKGAASERIALPAEALPREREARAAFLEALADHDDSLLEKLIEEVPPEPAEVFDLLSSTEAGAAVAELLIGCAERDAGVRRLWKALRHDTPDAAATAAARGIGPEGPPLAQVFRTVNAGHGGKLSWVRVWRGPLRDGASLAAGRIGGITRMPGGEPAKAAEAASGEIVALGRLDTATTGQVLGETGGARLDFPSPPPPVYALAIATADRKDDVRLSAALQKLLEEDPALELRQDTGLGETILAGQGELHLKAAMDRLAAAFGIRLTARRPRLGLRETIRRRVIQPARLKRQTGGHGQFADVTLEIAPRARGEGFLFEDRITGGVVPRQYIPAVGAAAEEAARKGAFGYPVVDIAVALVDGGFHSVDSSEMAFRTATRMAMQDALPKADPVLLEPMHAVTVTVPNRYTATAQRLLTGRRGQILGYAERPAWPGWDDVEALVPEAELHDFIIELRSQTMGLGSYSNRFDHLVECTGRMAQEMLRQAAGE